MTAVDRVLRGRNRNAFCVVRPPGHHAGLNGLLADANSHGFCIFNSVAAGALHALEAPEHRCARVAIIDIDVHHGNGTEEIVRRYPRPDRLLFFSIHLFDKETTSGSAVAEPVEEEEETSYEFYPGSGSGDNTAHNIINVPLMPLWRLANRQHQQQQQTQHASSSSSSASSKSSSGTTTGESEAPYVAPDRSNSASGHATRGKSKKAKGQGTNNRSGSRDSSGSDSGSRSEAEGAENSGPAGSPSPPPPPSSSSSSSSSSKDPRWGDAMSSTSATSGRRAFRDAIVARLIPTLRAFNPELIMLSTGFDALIEDVGNSRSGDKGSILPGIDLSSEDFFWVTREIQTVSRISPPAVLSALLVCYTPSSSPPLPAIFFTDCGYVLWRPGRECSGGWVRLHAGGDFELVEAWCFHDAVGSRAAILRGHARITERPRSA